MEYAIRPAVRADVGEMLGLFPRLASFELPPGRNPEDLWSGDAELLRAWAAGEAPGCVVRVAEAGGRVIGAAMARMRPELLSGAPSAHLEVLVVGAEAEGRGVGGALLADVEAAVRAEGAESLTLHVFSTNARARRVYERHGFEGELIRYIKQLG